MRLSNREIYMLSDGLLALIKNASEAIKLTNNEHAQCAISGDILKYQRLNSKLMSVVDRKNGLVEVDVFNNIHKKEELPDPIYALMEQHYPQEHGLDFAIKLMGNSQREVARSLGITPQNLSLWMSGRQAVSKKHLPELEKILGIPKEYLVRKVTTEDKLEIMRIVGGHNNEQTDG